MVGYPADEPVDAALVSVPHVVTPEITGVTTMTVGVPAPSPTTPRAVTPGAVTPGAGAPRRSGAPLPALGGDFLTAALDLLCRDEPLSRSEIGDHADVVAEVADALAAVADRLVRDLDALGTDAAGSSMHDLAGARDALHLGSSDSRRGAALLWARHIDELRAPVECVRPQEPTPRPVVAGSSRAVTEG